MTTELEVDAAGNGSFVTETLAAARDQLFEETGLMLPPVRVIPTVVELGGRSFRLRLNEIPLARAELPADAAAESAGAQVAAALLRLMRRRGHELVGIQETQALLAALESSHPALVREVVPKLVSPALLADVLRRLSAEGISLRQLPEILGALADTPATIRDAATLAERARAALRRAITFAHAGADGRLAAITLDPLVEETLRDAVRGSDGGAGSHLALEPQAALDILDGVGRALAAAPRAPAVILTASDLRRHVRRLVEVPHPDLSVLSYAELTPETEIETVARVSVR